ncbi:DUF3265 domain-containing protein [Vibrio vulnificus]|nr:DUF3265 domain-containing protein [Vibrio vulnificus]EIA0806902.1 DUF3265 domain-containing protein [Vibrio vulnificus]EIV8474090.1 DUF3265 domain-containing protein [Vibrio vulnificus]ELU2537325.1 DUF3265 domain-containing protein [Vibrio vulnificus]
MHAAWHFGFAVSFGGESGVRKLGLGGIHPLTQRYTQRGNMSDIWVTIITGGFSGAAVVAFLSKALVSGE